MSSDPAMLVWLDSNQQRKGKPNENYAREVMELFTLGRRQLHREGHPRGGPGVHRLAHRRRRAFAFDRRPARRRAEDGPRQDRQLGRRRRRPIVLEQPAARAFLVRKLYRFLVSETGRPPDALLEPLAERSARATTTSPTLVRTMLRSRLFFSEHAYRQRVKWPVEYVLGAVR